jgi:DNA polymerase I-like protein with 3'-5' exonuclease and polymerase domains
MLVVHDQIVMMCANKDVEAVSNIMIQSMTDAYNSIIPNIWNEVLVVADNVWDH